MKTRFRTRPWRAFYDHFKELNFLFSFCKNAKNHDLLPPDAKKTSLTFALKMTWNISKIKIKNETMLVKDIPPPGGGAAGGSSYSTGRGGHGGVGGRGEVRIWTW